MEDFVDSALFVVKRSKKTETEEPSQVSPKPLPPAVECPKHIQIPHKPSYECYQQDCEEVFVKFQEMQAHMQEALCAPAPN